MMIIVIPLHKRNNSVKEPTEFKVTQTIVKGHFSFVSFFSFTVLLQSVNRKSTRYPRNADEDAINFSRKTLRKQQHYRSRYFFQYSLDIQARKSFCSLKFSCYYKLSFSRDHAAYQSRSNVNLCLYLPS